MGGGKWDSQDYQQAAADRMASGQPHFDYDQKVKTGRASGIHPDLDPKKVAGPTSPLAGQNVRESRDSVEHPESLPVAMFFDVTGSMGRVPQVLQTKLAALMDVIIAKAGIKDSQILVGAIGDAIFPDRFPLQVGQFESDNRFDEQLRNIILEGGGGGQLMESYALAYRFAAYHTATDSFEKRGKKGYLFTMGDEMPWPKVTAAEVQSIFGVGAESDESVEDLLAKVQERWEVFHLFSMDGSYPNEASIHDRWRSLLHERFVKVDDSVLVCEVIAGIIHMIESAHDVNTVVNDLGLKGDAATTVRNALVPVSQSRVPAEVAKGGVPTSSHKGKPGVTRV